ncbi:MAG: hypothetical protein GY788_16350, partial [bacterium]|nr:hypothetical protein [bacterium]
GPYGGYIIGGAIIAGSIILTGGASIPVILGGAAIGAAIGFGYEAYQNFQEGKNLFTADFWENIDWSNVGQSAFHGAVSGAVAGVYAPSVSGLSLGWRAATMASVELLTGRAAQVAVNVVSGRHWAENVWNPRNGRWWLDVGLDILPGVAAVEVGLYRNGLKAARAATAADEAILQSRLAEWVARTDPVLKERLD